MIRERRGARASHVACAALTLVFLAGWVEPSAAQEIWRVTGGTTTISFHRPLLRDLGLRVFDRQNLQDNPDPSTVNVDAPYIAFGVDTASDLTFFVDQHIMVPYGLIDGTILHTGGFSIATRKQVTGMGNRVYTFQGLAIDLVPVPSDGPGSILVSRSPK